MLTETYYSASASFALTSAEINFRVMMIFEVAVSKLYN